MPLNADISIVFVTPSNIVFSIPKEFFQLSNSTFNLKTVNINKWEHQGEYCQKMITYIALLRSNAVLYCVPFNESETKKHIQNAVLSRFSSVKEIKHDDRVEGSNDYYILRSSKVATEYENAAFLGKESNTSFYFIKDRITSLEYFSPRFNYSCSMFANETIAKFVARTIGKMGKEFGYSFVIVSDAHEDSFNEYFSEVGNLFGDLMARREMSWDAFEPFRVIANVSRAKTSYFLIRALPTGTNVWMYPNEEVASSNSLLFFIKNIYSGEYLLGKSIHLNSASGQLVKQIMDIEEQIPSKKCSVVLFQNTKSWSNLDVLIAFREAAKRNRRSDINYFSVDQTITYLPWYVPTMDGFPSIVIWKPNDHRPFLFDQIMTVENIENWIRSLCN